MNSPYGNEDQMDVDGSSYYEDRSPVQPLSRGTKRVRDIYSAPSPNAPKPLATRIGAPAGPQAYRPRSVQSGPVRVVPTVQAAITASQRRHNDLVRNQRPTTRTLDQILAGRAPPPVKVPNNNKLVSAKAAYKLGWSLPGERSKIPPSSTQSPITSGRRFCINRSRDSHAARVAFFGRSPTAYLQDQPVRNRVFRPFESEGEEEEDDDEESVVRVIESGWIVNTGAALINLAVGLVATFLAWYNRVPTPISEEIVAVQTAPHSHKRRAVAREIASPQGGISTPLPVVGHFPPDISPPVTTGAEIATSGQQVTAGPPSSPPSATRMQGDIPAADVLDEASAVPRCGSPFEGAEMAPVVRRRPNFLRYVNPATTTTPPQEDVPLPKPKPAAAPLPASKSIFEGMDEERKRLLAPSACKLGGIPAHTATRWANGKPVESNKGLNSKATIKITSRKPTTTSKNDREIEALVERATKLQINSLLINSVRRNPRLVKELKERVELKEADLQAKEAEAAKKAADEEAARIAEQEAKAAQEAALKKTRIIKPLSEEWSKKVNETMATTSQNKVLATAPSGADLTIKDFDCLLGHNHAGRREKWLNDEVVNGFLDAAVARELEKTGHKKSEPAPVATYHSGWYNNVKANGVKAIARWSRRKHIEGDKLLKTRKVLMPINTGAHWLIMVISPSERKIELLDSLHGSSKHYFEIAREWLHMELGDSYVAEEWTEAKTLSSMQENMNDCGTFTCFNGLAAIKDVDYTQVVHADMQNGRRMIAAVLLNRGMTGEFDL